MSEDMDFWSFHKQITYWLSMNPFAGGILSALTVEYYALTSRIRIPNNIIILISFSPEFDRAHTSSHHKSSFTSFVIRYLPAPQNSNSTDQHISYTFTDQLQLDAYIR